MQKFLAFISLIYLLFIIPGVVLAREKPVAPTAPPVPSTPEVPAPPEMSGVFDVPDRPGMKVRVFVHLPKPTPPAVPGRTPLPSASLTPQPTSAPSLSCGLTDPDSGSVVGKAGWKIPAGNWIYQLNLSSVPPAVGQSNLDTIARAGFSQYSAASSSKVNFVRGSNTTITRARLDGKNIITWARASSGTLGVTYVWYYPQTGLTAEIDTIMNNRYKWTWSNSNVCADNSTYDAQNIMTHELGHWLGLEDEYDSASFGNNTMFGYGSVNEVKKNTLTTGDIAGVASIY